MPIHKTGRPLELVAVTGEWNGAATRRTPLQRGAIVFVVVGVVGCWEADCPQGADAYMPAEVAPEDTWDAGSADAECEYPDFVVVNCNFCADDYRGHSYCVSSDDFYGWVEAHDLRKQCDGWANNTYFECGPICEP